MLIVDNVNQLGSYPRVPVPVPAAVMSHCDMKGLVEPFEPERTPEAQAAEHSEAQAAEALAAAAELLRTGGFATGVILNL
jgi:hypothetical protein